MNTVEERLAAYRDVLDEAARAELPRAGTERRSSPSRRTALVAAAALALVGIVATALVIRQHDDHLVPVDVQPPIGRWRQGKPPPFDVGWSSQAFVLDDGRVLVVGPLPHISESAVEGGIYDPATDTWEAVPVAPITRGGATFRLAGNTLMAMTLDVQPVTAALLDLATMTWSEIAVPGAVSVQPSAWTWDGDVLAVVRAGPSFEGGDLPPVAVTMRWSRATSLWTDGATFPLAPRERPVLAASTDRIVVWGGQTRDPAADGATPVDFDVPEGTPTSVPPPGEPSSPSEPSAAFTDGAIYDVAANKWTTIPSDPQMLEIARRGASAFVDQQQLTMVSTPHRDSPRITVTLTDTGWQLLPSPEFDGYLRDDLDLVVVPRERVSGPQEAQYLDPVSWTWLPAPATALFENGSSLVALSTTSDNPGDDLLHAWLRTAVRGWRPAVHAPFVNRMDPAVAIVGDLVVIVGGAQGSELELPNDTWLLDLSPEP